MKIFRFYFNFFIFSLICFVFLLNTSKVFAIPGAMIGHVYVKHPVTNELIPIDGAKIALSDSDPTKEACRNPNYITLTTVGNMNNVNRNCSDAVIKPEHQNPPSVPLVYKGWTNDTGRYSFSGGGQCETGVNWFNENLLYNMNPSWVYNGIHYWGAFNSPTPPPQPTPTVAFWKNNPFDDICYASAVLDPTSHGSDNVVCGMHCGCGNQIFKFFFPDSFSQNQWPAALSNYTWKSGGWEIKSDTLQGIQLIQNGDNGISFSVIGRVHNMEKHVLDVIFTPDSKIVECKNPVVTPPAGAIYSSGPITYSSAEYSPNWTPVVKYKILDSPQTTPAAPMLDCGNSNTPPCSFTPNIPAGSYGIFSAVNLKRQIGDILYVCAWHGGWSSYNINNLLTPTIGIAPPGNLTCNNDCDVFWPLHDLTPPVATLTPTKVPCDGPCTNSNECVIECPLCTTDNKCKPLATPTKVPCNGPCTNSNECVIECPLCTADNKCKPLATPTVSAHVCE